MKNIVHFLERFQRRNLLIGAAVLLLIVYLGRWGVDAYATRQAEVESRMAQLGQYQLVTRRADFFEERLIVLLEAKEQLGEYFFTGEDDDKLASAMQLRVQAIVAKAGMRAESIRPLLQKTDGRQDGKGEGSALGEVLIKARLAGTLTEFMEFLAELYRGKEFFEIEGITIRPETSGLKILIDLKGYYLLPGQSGKDEEAEI